MQYKFLLCNIVVVCIWIYPYIYIYIFFNKNKKVLHEKKTKQTKQNKLNFIKTVSRDSFQVSGCFINS